MALQKKAPTDETEAPKKDAKKADGQAEKIAAAQAKIQADKEAGATAGTAAPKKEPEPKAEVAPEPKEVATQADRAVTTPVGKVTKIFENRKDVMVAAFGTFPRIKAAAGSFKDGDDNKYGTHLTFEILSHNDLYVITPNNGNQDDDEAKRAVRYSYDNVTTEAGEDVKDYIQQLKADGYDNACSKKYKEVVGMLMDCEKAGAVEDVIGQMVQLQLAPTSAAKFEGYIMSSSFHVARGTYTEDEAAVVKIKAKAASSNGNDYTLFTFIKHQ